MAEHNQTTGGGLGDDDTGMGTGGMGEGGATGNDFGKPSGIGSTAGSDGMDDDEGLDDDTVTGGDSKGLGNTSGSAAGQAGTTDR